MTISSLPAARIPLPTEAAGLRWGVVGPGGIANGMARAMRGWSQQKIVAVGSRSQERADAYASRYGIERAYDSYEAVAEDPEVDIVYISTTHNHHHGPALAAIAAGKPVLIEKAFTLNAQQAREIRDAAQAAGLLVVEAMWPRFGARYDIVRQLLADGAIGDVIGVQADHSQALTHVPRLMDINAAGGAMLDLGIYPVSFASFVLGKPGTVSAVGVLGETGVDESVAIHLTDHENARAVASLTTTLLCRGTVAATILGTEGRIELDSTSFYAPGPVRLVTSDGTRIEAPTGVVAAGDGLAYEAAHMATLVRDGATDSPLMPLEETVSVMETMDEIRRQIGLVYPEER